MRNRNIGMYVVFGLLAIGLLVSISNLIIPIAVFAVIFLLYKFPPDRWRRFKWSGGGRKPRGKTRNAKFRVIPGSKDSSDEPPKYH
ncbi:hypothetical protein [Paenibacillus ginsengihumi]|uniref:hypothetical protein n=1 Tax=Paenibacillus ginsengihumi TaxID=431596 RepID=UPI0003A4BEC2|nr:hypothetical protein [Paenibacillus ginsengihumi]